MAQLQTNPWSLVSTDPATATITGATGLTLNADGTVTITTTAAYTWHTASDVVPNRWFTVIGAANALYNGFYTLITGASGGTSFIMRPNFSIPAGTAQSGSGTLAQCLYQAQIRIEDISWQNATAAGHTLDLRDSNGNPIWQATATGAGSQNRGKVFWVDGLTPITITSGIVLITVD